MMLFISGTSLKYPSLSPSRIPPFFISQPHRWKRFKETEIPYDDGVYITYVNAEVDDGSEVAKLMEYFKEADPEDMSQGDLSARIHFLKCEEGGYTEMCKVSEIIYKEGKREGIIEGKKETAFSMKNKGYSDDIIAEILDVGINVIQQWLSGSMVKH